MIFFGKDPLIKNAELLVPTARMAARWSFSAADKEFSFLKNGEIARWDFTLTVAGVFIGSTMLKQYNVGAARKERALRAVDKALSAWDAMGRLGLENCRASFDKNYDHMAKRAFEPQVISANAIGMWVAWQLLERRPTEDERRFVTYIGLYIIQGFSGFWFEGLGKAGR